VFEFLPWIDWAYLGLMFAVGAVLIVSGLGVPVLTNRPSQRAGAAQRGLEVLGVSEGGPGR
jgi:hypothetical protein